MMENSKISVLIADDNKEFCSILSDYLLNQKNIIVTGTAKDGKEALELIQEKEPDLVVLDIIMPHLDGLGVLEQLRKMDLEKKPRVIILSAVGQDKITQQAINLGADYYVVKPFDMDIFTKRIIEMFNGAPKDKSSVNSVANSERSLSASEEALDLETEIWRFFRFWRQEVEDHCYSHAVHGLLNQWKRPVAKRKPEAHSLHRQNTPCLLGARALA